MQASHNENDSYGCCDRLVSLVVRYDLRLLKATRWQILEIPIRSMWVKQGGPII